MTNRLAQAHIALTLVVIIMLSSFHSVASFLTEDAIIRSSGQISYVLARPLHAEERYIKDDLGNTIYLRGVNWDGYQYGYYGDWPAVGDATPHVYRGGPWDDSRPRAHFQHLRDTWGINVMRWNIVIQYWLENPENYRQHIRRGIELAQEYGIYVLLAPWRVSGADWNRGAMPFPPYDVHSDVIANQQDFIDFWVSVASELSDLPNWLIDPYNEPNDVSGSTYYEDRAVWFDVVSRLISAVREVCDNIILVQWMEGAWYAGWNRPSLWVDDFITYLEAKGTTENIVIATHTYKDHLTYFAITPRPNTPEQLLAEYTSCGLTHAATEISYPLLIGEIGCDDRLTGEDWTQQKILFTNQLSLYNQWGVSYIGWIYASPRETGRNFCLLADGNWIPPPSESGQILIDAIERGRA